MAAGFSIRDVYPNAITSLSTSENTVPEAAEQVYYSKGEEAGIIQPVTKKDKMNILLGIGVIAALMFAFGLID